MELYSQALQQLKQVGLESLVCSDIKIRQDPNWTHHRQWANQICCENNLSCENNLICYQPLWERDPDILMDSFFDLGFKGQFVSVKAALIDQHYLGQFLTPNILDTFTKKGVHRCGERGEYHTVIIDGPLFQIPLSLILNSQNIFLREGYWHADFDPRQSL